MQKKLIITGASGFLGYHLLRLASANWQVYGITHNNAVTFPKATLVSCDISNYIEFGNLVDDIEPDAIMHAAAISNTNYCQHHPTEAYSVNVEATANIAGICSDYQIPFVFTSTDLVFDGTKGMYNEEDERNPISVYGEQKCKAEDEVLKLYPLASVYRLPLMFGNPQASAGNYLQKFMAQIKQGEKAALFNDEYRSMCGAQSICQGMLQLFEHTNGIYHLAGKEKLSRYEFGIKAATALGLNETLITSCSQKDVKMAAPRPPDVSLDISKAIALGYAPLSINDELQLIAGDKYL